MEAITAGSASMAGEMADQVRRRTIVADDLAERVARKVLRRSHRKESRRSRRATAARRLHHERRADTSPHPVPTRPR